MSLSFLFCLVFLSGAALGRRTPMGGTRIRSARPLKPLGALKPGVLPNFTQSGASGVFGVDVSDPNIAASSWACMHSNGNYSFAIVECWRGGYQLSPCADNIANAWNGGFQDVDVYAFMCPQCNNGPQSVQALVNFLRQNSVRFGMIWMDIEQCDGCWYGDLGSNCAWVQSLASTYQSLGIHLGIYASAYEWSVTVGSGCSLPQFPLWYADYDYNPSFSGFQPFGGWNSPAMKQFSDSASNACGVSVDRDWYP